jgi:hypothetical protein
MLDTMPASEHDTWRSRLWRLVTALEAAFDNDPIECLERRVSALEPEVNGAPPQRANRNDSQAQLANSNRL